MSASSAASSVVSAATVAASSSLPWYRVRLYLIRHGESEMNTASHLLGGQSNSCALTSRGQMQAHLLGQRIKFDNVNFDQVYSSTAVRAISTAQLALRSAGREQQKVQQEDALLEQGQGEWEGKHREEVYTPKVMQDMLDLVRTNRDTKNNAFNRTRQTKKQKNE